MRFVALLALAVIAAILVSLMLPAPREVPEPSRETDGVREVVRVPSEGVDETAPPRRALEFGDPKAREGRPAPPAVSQERPAVQGGTIQVEALPLGIKRWLTMAGEDKIREAQSDDNGRYVFEEVPPGEYVVTAYPTPDEVRAALGRHGEQGMQGEQVEILLTRTQEVEVRAGETTLAILEIMDLPPVEVKVRILLDGQPPRGGTVQAIRDGKQLYSEFQEGQGALSLLPGPWRLRYQFWTEGELFALEEEEVVPPTTHHELELLLVTGTLGGRVSTSAGDAVSNANLEVFGTSSGCRVHFWRTADDHGTFSITDVPEGSYVVRASEGGEPGPHRLATRSCEVLVTAGTTSHADFRLGPGGNVAFLLPPLGPGDTRPRLLFTRVTDVLEVEVGEPPDDTLQGVPVGLYDVRVLGTDYELAESSPFEVVEGEFRQLALVRK